MMAELLRGLVHVSCRRPTWTVALALLVSAVGVAYAAHALTFKTSTRALLPQTAGYVLRYAEYTREFGELDDIVIVVEAASFPRAREYAVRLTQALRESPVTFPRIAHRVDPSQFEGRQLLYLSTAELREIRDLVFDHQEFLERFVADPSLVRLLENVNEQVAAAFLSSVFDLGLQDRDETVDTRFLSVLLEQIASRLEHLTPYRSPWGTLFPFANAAAPDAGYFLSKDKRLLFVLVETPPGRRGSFVGDREFIETIRGAIGRLGAAFPDVRAGVTGAPALSNDEMSAAFRDSRLATILAGTLVLLAMTLAFGGAGRPLLMLAVLAITLGWTIGIVTLTVGHLTLFSVMFIPIVLGIGIDYGNYYLFRYREHAFDGHPGPARDLAAARAGPGIVISALTAGGTFLVLILTDFRGIQELGFIAGISILLAGLGMLTVFPALLALGNGDRSRRSPGGRPGPLDSPSTRFPMLDRLTRVPRAVLIVAGAATVPCISAVRHVEFDYNVLNLQAEGTESVVWEKRILSNSGRSGVTGLSSARTLDELRLKRAAFAALPSVSAVDSVLRVIPDEQPEKLSLIRSFAPLLAPLRMGTPSPVDLDHLERTLSDLQRRVDVMATGAGADLPPEVHAVRQRLDVTLGRLRRAQPNAAGAALGDLQAQLHRDLADKLDLLQRNLTPSPLTLADTPEELRRRFVGSEGRLLIQVHPRVDIWTKDGARTFVRDLRRVDPDSTGPPVITYEATRLMERAYLQGTLYALALVTALSLVAIRRLRESLLALAPLGLGLLWTIGVMHAFGIKFNLANVWGLPMIIGASAEFGLNITLRHMEASRGPSTATAGSASTLRAVALNGLITIVAFGSLTMASYRGISSLGLLLTIGAACNLLASLVVLPALLTIAGARRTIPADMSPRGS